MPGGVMPGKLMMVCSKLPKELLAAVVYAVLRNKGIDIKSIKNKLICQHSLAIDIMIAGLQRKLYPLRRKNRLVTRSEIKLQP